MSAGVVTWSPDMESLGDAVIAIGVFDGVHIGHQSLLRATVAEATRRGVSAVAVTFDRDPDQVVAPETAAPQLLSLADKIDFIAQSGVDSVLVVPFTQTVAGMAPEVFLDSILLAALRPVVLNVGHDFRFGARAKGDLGTLERFGMERGFHVVGHELVTSGGLPVTSTRIRRHVAAGECAEATVLLGRPPRVSGTVHRGRGEGASLGFPTANVVPEPYSALPADGVYAGRAILPDGTVAAAAISVGTPPSFPEARDYLEAHLIDFDADLYDRPLTLEFSERLRGQRAFASLPELTAAIGVDVARATEIATRRADAADRDDEQDRDIGRDANADSADGAGAWNPNIYSAVAFALLGVPLVGADPRFGFGPDTLPDGSPIVSDPAALEAGERAVRNVRNNDVFDNVDGEWVELFGPTVISGIMGSAGWNGLRITMPLSAAGIPFAWQPYDPAEMPGFRAAYGVVDRPFSLDVPAEYLDIARATLLDAGVGGSLAARIAASRTLREDSEPWLEDAALLASAEEAVRTRPSPEVTPIDWDSWIPLLAEQPYDRRRLLGLQSALESVGIPVKWDPFSPAETPLLKQGFFHRDVFTLAVPDDRLDEAQQLVEEYEATQAKENANEE